MKKTRNLVAVSATLCFCFAQPASAIDVDPGDYIPLPDGTNAFLGYFQHLESESFNVDGTEVPGSELSANVGVARYLRYFEWLDKPAGVQAFLPFGSFSDAQVGGADLEQNDGPGDLTIGLTLWPIASAPDDLRGTTLGFTAYGSFSTGDYTVGQANLGNGSFTITPQVGLIKGLGRGLFLDAAYDVAFTQDFSDSGIDVSVDPLHQAQIWLRQQFSAVTYVAAGYNGQRGGDVSANGAATGVATDHDEIRLSFGHFINPTTQLSGRISHDVDTENGFSSEPNIQLRLMKLF